jgi:putative transcriptional regulator
MKEELFQELLESVRQGGAILRGEVEPARVVNVAAETVDVGALRKKFKLSQPKFAALLGISVGTLRNWEQGRRLPEGPARVLLRVAAENPYAVLETVSGARGRQRIKRLHQRSQAKQLRFKTTRITADKVY